MKNRYSATLLLALPYVIALAPAFANPARPIAITLSSAAISPPHIEMQAGRRVRLTITSADGVHAVQIKGLRLAGRIPAAGRTVTFDLVPTEPGTFQIECFDDGGGARTASAVVVVTQ